jgi:ribosome-binding protein aMBF1 (putative translation factor)
MMSHMDLFDEGRCAACGKTIEGDPHPLRMGSTETSQVVSLCDDCAEDPLPASYVARRRAKKMISAGLDVLDVAERLEEMQVEGLI